MNCSANLGALRCALPRDHKAVRHPLVTPLLSAVFSNGSDLSAVQAHRSNGGVVFIALKPFNVAERAMELTEAIR
jgi:hypothetical protein